MILNMTTYICKCTTPSQKATCTCGEKNLQQENIPLKEFKQIFDQSHFTHYLNFDVLSSMKNKRFVRRIQTKRRKRFFKYFILNEVLAN